MSLCMSDHGGGDFDDFLRNEGILEETEAIAVDRVRAFEMTKEPERAQDD